MRFNITEKKTKDLDSLALENNGEKDRHLKGRCNNTFNEEQNELSDM